MPMNFIKKPPEMISFRGAERINWSIEVSSDKLPEPFLIKTSLEKISRQLSNES